MLTYERKRNAGTKLTLILLFKMWFPHLFWPQASCGFHSQKYDAPYCIGSRRKKIQYYLFWFYRVSWATGHFMFCWLTFGICTAGSDIWRRYNVLLTRVTNWHVFKFSDLNYWVHVCIWRFDFFRFMCRWYNNIWTPVFIQRL